MNPLVAALYDNLDFCPRGCKGCIGALRQRVHAYQSSPSLDEWQLIAALDPAELVTAPHWEQRLRHLLWGGGATPACQYPQLGQIIAQWQATSQQLDAQLAPDRARIMFLDFLVWDMCHKMKDICAIDNASYSGVIDYCTETAFRTAHDLFGQPEFDSLVESLVIVRDTDNIAHPDLDNLLSLPWPADSRTSRVIHAAP
ncbi:MAG: hypothetical protein KF716_19965 [Anaerolineae bacterium]|nr:hypothetical protein [Anaerolineae bacterium]